MKQTSLRRVKSADRTLDLLETLAGAANPMTATDLSRVLDIPKSSLSHLAGTLISRGYLQLDKGNHYHLTAKLGDLARKVTLPADITAIIEPILAELCADLNETTSFNIAHGDQVKVVATHQGRQNLSFMMRTGDLAPLYAVSSGKVILSEMTNEQIEAYLERVRLEAFTRNTIQSAEHLWRDIERTRVEGLGFVDEEFTPGIVGMAVPVRQGGTLVGVVNVPVPKARVTPELVARIRQRLRCVTEQVGNILDQGLRRVNSDLN